MIAPAADPAGSPQEILAAADAGLRGGLMGQRCGGLA
jgi:hypothetical protein